MPNPRNQASEPDDVIAYLADNDPTRAEDVLRAQGYTLEEWRRAREATPALDLHGATATQQLEG